MFRKIFGPDSDLMIVMTWITDAIFLSLFWIIGCVPVVTIGASTAALYDASYRAFRHKNKHSWQRFVYTFKNSLKGGIVPGIFVLAMMLAGGWILVKMWNNAVLAGAWLAFAVGAVIGVVLLGILSVVLPMVSRFENRSMTTVRNAFAVAMANLPRTVLLGLLQAVTIFACVRLILPILVLPSLSAVLSSLLIEPMFKPYLPEDFYEMLSDD